MPGDIFLKFGSRFKDGGEFGPEWARLTGVSLEGADGIIRYISQLSAKSKKYYLFAINFIFRKAKTNYLIYYI
tara:strand:- start:70 stop:288 length:219 start_codon:yes stop_codon:yes gene_type:complete